MGSVTVPNTVTDDPSGGFTSVGGVHETNNRRDLSLYIREKDGAFRLRVDTDDPALQAALGADLQREVVIPVTRAELAGYAQECRQAWMAGVVNLQVDGVDVFQSAWDFSADPGPLQAALPRIAEAGAKLFLAIFYPQRFDGGANDEALRRIGLVLRREMASASRWIKVFSNAFFAPWGLIYSERYDQANIDLGGFWGFQHVVEHVPSDSGSMGNELAFAQPLRVGFQIDTGIDNDLGVPCIAPVRQLLGSYGPGLILAERPLREMLRQALSSGPWNDQILYFCCHARQEGDSTRITPDQSVMILSDRPEDAAANWITPSDIGGWMDINWFQTGPLVFINACEGGQMNSLFYEGFGRKFLGLRASAVIGPQTEVPAIFAGEFARRFFQSFFQGGADRQVGKILFELRREFLQNHNKPLGMIYSLYRGGDVFLPGPPKGPLGVSTQPE